MMCLGVFLLGSSFFGTLWAPWTSWKSISFTRLGKFSFIMFSNKFSFACSSSSPSGTPMIWISEHLKLSQRFLSLSSFFELLCLHSVLVECFGVFFCSKLLIWVLVSFASLFVHCIFFFISLSMAFTSSYILYPNSMISVSILITSVLNSALDRLAISSLLSCIFSGALICSFLWAIFFSLSWRAF